MMVRGFLATPVPTDVAYSPATVAVSVAEGLAARGHEITFFGPEGTSLKGCKTETCNIRPLVKSQQDMEDLTGTHDLFRQYIPSLYDTTMVREILERATHGEFDCVVFHHFESALPLAKQFPKVPIVHILHDYIDERRRQVIEMHESPNQYFISISDSQRRDAPDLNYAKTVYNGIDLDLFDFEAKPEDYLMIAGRVTPEKGVKEAVQVALQTGKRLLIAGSLLKSDYWYFDEHVKPYLNDKILFLGMLDRERLARYYKKAAAVLVPIQWQEPFGLSMAEANACGTPVIAFRRGSVPEVVVDGKTGFIVDNSAEMILAIDKLSSINRNDCRAHVEKSFSQETMVKNYETALCEIVALQSIPKKTRKNKPIAAQSELVRKRIKEISKKLLSPPQKRQ